MDQHFIKSIKRGVAHWLGLRAKDIVLITFHQSMRPNLLQPCPDGYQRCGCEWIHRPTRISGDCVYIFREDMPQMLPAVVDVDQNSEWRAAIPQDDVLTVFAPEEPS